MIRNEHTDEMALAAADSYVENFRCANVKVKLTGIAPGAMAHIKLKRHAFMFGAAVAGFDRNVLFVENPSRDTDAAHYQQALKRHFNTIVPGNAGKWAYNEKERDVVSMQYIGTLRDYAKKHDLKMRMHTLLWNTEQQPRWIIDLLDAAAKGNQSAKKQLREQISQRIVYYVRDRAESYVELDVLNESLHQPKYWEVFGAEGIADIYREAAQAVADASATTRVCVNEYNVLQYSSSYPFKRGAPPDPYCNWYRQHVEQLRAAGAPVSGIGVQYYAFTEPDIPSPHSAARIHAVFQNLSVTGLPIALTEFGVKTKSDPSRVPDLLEETLRITFGNPNATGFIMWGFWTGDLWDQARGAAFYDDKWEPTPTCKRWDEVMRRWSVDDTLPVADDGTVTFTGYFGDYDITVDGKTSPITLVKGTSDYTAAAP
jgi:GH35 family endo-1,4-beta-xylanase